MDAGLLIVRLVVGHESGEDHSERLWALVNLEMWLRQFVDGEDIGAPAPAHVGVATSRL